MIFPEFSPTPEAPVLVIGGAGVDMVGRLKAELKQGVSNPANIRISFGGVGRNVAENLVRLGQPVRLITAIGDDLVGEQLVDLIEAAGVDVSAILRSDEHSTGSYMGVINSGGTLHFALDDINAASAITPAYLHAHADLFQGASLVFIDANLPVNTLRTVFSLAGKAHLPVCADPTSPSLAKRLQSHLARLQMISPNGAEAAILCDRPFQASKRQEAIDAAKCLVGKGVRLALLSLAEYGVVYATSETSGHVPAIRTKIVDPTGAGDALTATVIFSLLNEISLDDAVRLGVTAATLTLQHRGTVIPDLSLEMLYDHLVI
jgi:pseudouridine kinase